MKKIYLFGVLLSAAINFNAQVIYSQPTTTTDGIVSDVLADGTFVATADDFTLTTKSKITKITVQGFQNVGNLETVVSTGAMLYIYANSAGSPAGIPKNNAVTPIAAIDIAKGAAGYSLVKSGTSNYAYTIDLTQALPSAVNLEANTVYWLVFAAKTNLTAYTGTTRFNWFAGTVGGNPAKLVDPSNAFGAGATNWTSLSSLTGTPALNGLAFSIEGETVLGVGEVFNSNKLLTVYPNPTADYLVLASKSEIKNVSVYDISGKKLNVNFDGEKLDVRNIKAGSYLVNVESKDGKKTEKFIKK